MQYRIRVDSVPAFSMLDLKRYIDKYATSYCLVRHEPVKPNIHYHIWMETNNADSTVRLMLTKHMPYLKGNAGHSVQMCDPLRKEEYLQYLFNRKHGNRAFFESHQGVDNWEVFQERSNLATTEYLSTKKGKVYSKNDCVEDLIAQNSHWENVETIFAGAMALARSHKVVFSINALRDIIVAVGFNAGSQDSRQHVQSTVLKIFTFL